MGVVGSILTNVTSNYIYDLSRGLKRKSENINIDELVGTFIDDFIDSDIDSGSFENFLKLHEVKVDFRNFITYMQFRKNKFDDNIVNKSVFIESIAGKAIEYVKSDINKNLNYDKVKEYFEKLIDIIEENFIIQTSKEDRILLYYIQSRLDDLEKNILQNLSNKVEKNNELIEQTSELYVNIIKKRYSKDHVYGFDKLSLKEFYVKPKFEIYDLDNELELGVPYIKKRRTNTIQWKDIFKYFNMISIVGGAGFGKSLFLKNIASNFNELNIFNSNNLIPIYCDLKLYTEYSIGKRSYSIEEFLVDCMINTSGMDRDDINKNFLRYFLSKGRCLILLDALDEVDSSEREELHEKIILFFKSTNFNNKICITSRELGFYQETPISYKVKNVDRESIEIYIENMSKLGFFEYEDKNIFLEQSNHLIEKGFLNSFLILSLLLNIFKAERELPANKVDLYEKCVKYIAINREKHKQVKFKFDLMSSILDSDASFERLASLARPNNKNISKSDIVDGLLTLHKKRYIDQNKTNNAIEEFLRFCSERTELFVLANEDSEYKFYHRSFFEFYYANYLRKNVKEDSKLLKELCDFTMDSEIFELIITLLKKHDLSRYEDLIEFTFELIEDSSGEIDTKWLFNVLIIFLSISDEEVFIERLYYLCFDLGKLPDVKYMQIGYKLIDIVEKYNGIEGFFERCMKTYKEYIFSAFFFNSQKYSSMYRNYRREKNISIFIKNVPPIFRHICDENEYIKSWFIECELDQYYSLDEYKSMIMKNLKQIKIENEDEDINKECIEKEIKDRVSEAVEEFYDYCNKKPRELVAKTQI